MEGIVKLIVDPSKMDDVSIGFMYNWPSCESTKVGVFSSVLKMVVFDGLV